MQYMTVIKFLTHFFATSPNMEHRFLELFLLQQFQIQNVDIELYFFPYSFLNSKVYFAYQSPQISLLIIARHNLFPDDQDLHQ